MYIIFLIIYVNTHNFTFVKHVLIIYNILEWVNISRFFISEEKFANAIGVC